MRSFDLKMFVPTLFLAVLLVAGFSVSAYALVPPLICDPGGPYTGVVGVPVQFDGSASDDLNGGIDTYDWNFGDSSTGTGPTPTHTYASAEDFTVTLTVTDELGNSATCTTTAHITQGNSPPDCSGASPSINMLWPPNKKFASVDVIGVTDPDGDPITIIITAISQDEPVGKQPDGMGIGTSTAQVRAERNGKDNGRVYQISFTSDDGQGGICTGSVYVSVPHDQSGMPAVNDGPLYDSTTAE